MYSCPRNILHQLRYWGQIVLLFGPSVIVPSKHWVLWGMQGAVRIMVLSGRDDIAAPIINHSPSRPACLDDRAYFVNLIARPCDLPTSHPPNKWVLDLSIALHLHSIHALYQNVYLSRKTHPGGDCYQLARPDEISTDGLDAYRIVTLVIVEVAVILRMVGRRLQRIALRLDDYLLIFSAVRCCALRSIPAD